MALPILLGLVLFQGTPTDTLKSRALDEVVVTATRTDRSMGALPLPVTVVNAKQIHPETLASKRVTLSQYGGLFNRSRHMANLKLFYEQPKSGLSASLRGIYRGRYGYGDLDDNLILDSDKEYVQWPTSYHQFRAESLSFKQVMANTRKWKS